MEFKAEYNQAKQRTDLFGFITDLELSREKEVIKKLAINNLANKIAEHLFKRIEPKLDELFTNENIYPEMIKYILEKCQGLKDIFNYDYNRAFELENEIVKEALIKYPGGTIDSVVFLVQETLKKVYDIEETSFDIGEYILQRCRELIKGYKTYQEAESYIRTITKEVMRKFPDSKENYTEFMVKQILKQVYSQ